MRGEFLDIGGVRLYYYAAGSRGAGEPVVLLHGFPTSGHLWTDVVPQLPAGHRVIVLDLLGFGRSDRPRQGAMDLRSHANRVVAVLDALRVDEACIVGHDIGGGIAQVLAVTHPTRVSRLGLVDSVAFDAWPPREVKLARAALPVARHMPPGLLHSIVRSDMLRGYLDHERGAHDVDLYLRPFLDDDGRDALITHLRSLECRETVEIAPRLAEVAKPTAVVWGERDPFLPLSIGERLHEAIPNSTLDVIPGARHFTPHESCHAVARAIGQLLKR